jgi:hypothetical protein
MDRNYIDEHHIVARYLADRLSDTEREAFEAYYLEHPDIVQDMEAVARLKVGLARLQESGELGKSLAAPHFPRSYYIAAAAAVVVAAAGFLFLSVREPPQQGPILTASAATLLDRSGAPLAVTDTYRVLRTRSGAADANILLTDSSQAIALRILPDFPAVPARYRIEVSAVPAGSEPESLAAVGNLAVEADGFILVYLDSSRLTSGTYVLTLAGETGTDAADTRSDFTISVSAPLR